MKWRVWCDDEMVNKCLDFRAIAWHHVVIKWCMDIIT